MITAKVFHDHDIYVRKTIMISLQTFSSQTGAGPLQEHAEDNISTIVQYTRLVFTGCPQEKAYGWSSNYNKTKQPVINIRIILRRFTWQCWPSLQTNTTLVHRNPLSNYHVWNDCKDVWHVLFYPKCPFGPKCHFHISLDLKRTIRNFLEANFYTNGTRELCSTRWGNLDVHRKFLSVIIEV